MTRIKEYANVPVALIYNMIGRFISLKEKNNCKFKKEDKLQKNALLLYIFLHFIADSKGTVNYKSAKEFAKELKCSAKTVLRNLKKLQKNKIISETEKVDFHGETWGKNSLGLRKKITIQDYDKMHKNKMGYIQISFEQFKALLDSANIYELRLNLRLLTDEVRHSSQKNEKHINELRQILGVHVKKSDIQDMLNNSKFVSFTEYKNFQNETIFEFSSGELQTGVEIKKKHQEDAGEIADEFENVIKLLNHFKGISFSSFFEKISQCNFFNIDRTESFRLFMSKKTPTVNAFCNLEQDIATLRNKYSVNEIKAAIRKFFKIATANNYNPKKSIGIYIRNILEKDFKFA